MFVREPHYLNCISPARQGLLIVGVLGTDSVAPMSSELEELYPKSGGMFLQAGRRRIGKSPCTSLEPHH